MAPQPPVWRGRFGFEKGAIGDRGNDGFDTMFRALKLSSSTSVEASSTPRFPETYRVGSLIHWEFPARGNRAPVTIHGYDGDPPTAAGPTLSLNRTLSRRSGCGALPCA
jgi:hypothetical protein